MFTIGTLARRTGIRPSAIRYYEALGILAQPHRLPNGYRVYEEEAVAALQFLRRAQLFGLQLPEIRQLLELIQTGVQPCACVRALARRQLRTLEVQIREFEALAARLRRILRQPTEAPRHGEVCPLLQREA